MSKFHHDITLTVEAVVLGFATTPHWIKYGGEIKIYVMEPSNLVDTVITIDPRNVASKVMDAFEKAVAEEVDNYFAGSSKEYSDEIREAYWDYFKKLFAREMG